MQEHVTYMSATLNIGKLIMLTYIKSITYLSLTRSIKLPMAPDMKNINNTLIGRNLFSTGSFKYKNVNKNKNRIEKM